MKPESIKVVCIKPAELTRLRQRDKLADLVPGLVEGFEIHAGMRETTIGGLKRGHKALDDARRAMNQLPDTTKKVEEEK